MDPVVQLFVAAGQSAAPLMVGALGFNGLCVTGFLVAGQVFVNRQASAEVRASVLGLLTFVNGAPACCSATSLSA